MTAEHQSLMQGMSNFRAFQLGAQEFFTSAKAVWQADQRRRTRNLIVVGIVAALLTPGIWMAVDWAGEVVREVEQAHSDYRPMETGSPIRVCQTAIDAAST